MKILMGLFYTILFLSCNDKSYDIEYAVIKGIENKYYVKNYFRQKVYFNYSYQNKMIDTSSILKRKFGIISVNDTLVVKINRNEIENFEIVNVKVKNWNPIRVNSLELDTSKILKLLNR